MKVALVFPPGWSLFTGSPHLGLPTLAGSLKKHGHEFVQKDCNAELFYHEAFKITESDVKSVFQAANEAHFEGEDGELAAMNKPYFDAEDALNKLARQFKGGWSLQLGFQYDDYSPRSSDEVMASMKMWSPFTDYYRMVVIPWLQNEKPTLLAVSIAAPAQIIPAFQLFYAIRQAGLDIKITIGGNVISRIWEEMVKQPKIFNLVNYIGVFQGDYTIVELCKAIAANSGFEKVTGLIWRKDDGAVKVNHFQVRCDLRVIPTPFFDGLPVGNYWGVNYLSISACRGCYHGKCYFCAIPFGWNENGFAGIRPVEKVFNDLTTLYKIHEQNKFKFVDESMPPDTMKRLALMISESKLPFKWEAFTIMEKCFVDQNFLDLLYQGGCRKLYFGLETVSEYGRKKMNKRGSINPYDLLNRCLTAGIKVHLFTMIGFPGTGVEDAEETVRFIIDHNQLIDTVDIFPFTLQKHTNVPGVKPIKKRGEDWALDYPYVPTRKGVLPEPEVKALCDALDDQVWEANPFLRHPIYRLLSPWGGRDRKSR